MTLSAESKFASARSFARRSRTFESSPWSEAWDLIQDKPDAIYFGNGAPAEEAQPIVRLQQASARAWQEAAGALDYGEVAGYEPLRELIARRMRLRGIDAPADAIMVTSGSQQGIDLIARLMLDPGDAIIVEGPTYIGAMQTFDAYEATYVTAPMDEGGVDPEALGALLDTLTVRPKLFYTMPTFQNPTGFTLRSDRREALLQLAREREFLIVEDDPYGELYFGEPPLPALRRQDPDVIYLGTFSKTIAPGIRVGWLVAPPKMLDLLLMAKEGADINGDRITTRTVFYTSEGFLDDHVVELRKLYQRRRDALLSTMAETMPAEVRWSHPGGGFFVWVELPDDLSASDLLRLSATYGVAFLPGSWFYPNGQGSVSGFRLSYSALSEERLVEGARRLGQSTNEFFRQVR
jgi:2-aminoadipate transaminase